MQTDNSTPPPIVPRPAFARWIWDRKLELRDVAERIQCSSEQVRLICLPFDDAKRRVPGEELIERIFEFTGGEIGPADFYPERLRKPADALEPQP